MATVTRIPATVSRFTAAPIQSKVKRKVAAYARVSTDHEDQQNSYEAQCDYYTTYIQGNDEWDFAGIYAERCPLSLIQMHPKPILGCIFLREGCI